MKRLALLALLCLFQLPAQAANHPFQPSESREDESLSLQASEAPELFQERDADALEAFDRQQSDETDADVKPGAAVLVHIDKRIQRMTVEVDGKVRYSGWKVSTGMPGYETRSGTFTPFEMNKSYYSKEFRVILPYGIKFDGGNLIHAASVPGQQWLGQAHSHGCVRLLPANAKTLFNIVSRAGMKNTRVIVF
jgi:lipoprotein-anchoring transpeptidase ErfK/SrfK